MERVITMHKKTRLATISALIVFGAASTSLAGSLNNETLELTEAQLDAVTAGSIGVDAVSGAVAIGPVLALTFTNATGVVGTSFVDEEIRGTAAVGNARGLSIAAGEGSVRATSADTSLNNPGGTTFSAGGVFDGGIMKLEYSATAGYNNVGFGPIF